MLTHILTQNKSFMNIKTSSLKKGVFLSSLLLFLFLLTSIKAKASDFVSDYSNSLFTNTNNNVINDVYNDLNRSEEFDSVVKKGGNTLSENNLKVKSSSLPNKYDDKFGGAFFLRASKDYIYNGFSDVIALNYDLLLVSKIKLFLFYSSPKLPSLQ